MKNRFNMRKVAEAVLDTKYLALGLAAVICLLLFAGIHAASASPTEAPPGGDVVPNFSGLNVSGIASMPEIKSADTPLLLQQGTAQPIVIGSENAPWSQLKVNGNITTGGVFFPKAHIQNNAAGDNPVKIKDNEGLKIVDASGNPGVLDVGKIKNSNSAVAIDDDLTVNGNSKFVSTGIGYLLNVEEIEVPGHDPTYRTTVNSELYGDKLAKLGKRDDGYHVLEVLPNIGAAGGHAAIRGSFNVVDKLGAGFYEDGDGTAAGVELSDFGIKLPFNRPAKVTISKEGNINTEGNLQIYGEISNPGGFPAGEPVAINDNLQVFGTASVTDYLNVSKIRAYDTVNGTLIFESPLKIGAESPGNGADLTVHGHVKAQGFGTYIEEPSGYKSISDGSTGTQSVACSAGNHISSCGAKIYWWNTFLGYKIAIDTPVTRIYSDPTTNTCYVSAVNNSGNIRYLKASAICLDPNQ